MTVWNLLGSFAKETGQRIFAALRNAATFYEQVEDWKGAEDVENEKRCKEYTSISLLRHTPKRFSLSA